MKKIFKCSVVVTLVIVLLVVVFVTKEFTFAYMQGSSQENLKKIETRESEEKGNKEKIPDNIQVLLIGSDARSIDENGRSDTLMVAQYNTKNKSTKLLSIMRDCYVTIPGFGEDKINSALSYGGEELLKETLQQDFSLDPPYYVIVTFKEFEDAIDELFPKGLLIDVEKDLTVDKVSLSKGEQYLSGNQVLQYTRFRKDEESDFGRVRRQQQVMEAIAEQAKSLTVMSRLPKVIGKISGQIETNIPLSILTDFLKEFLIGDMSNLETLSIPIDKSWNFDDNTPSGSVLSIDEEKNKKAIEEFFE